MRNRRWLSQLPSYGASLLLFIILVAVLILAWWFSGFPSASWVITVGILFSGTIAWLFGEHMQWHQKEQTAQAETNANLAQLDQMQSWLDAALRLDRGLLDAKDEHSLMDMALRQIAELAHVPAVTYVPTDKWGQPVAVFTFGNIQEGLLQAHAEHLASPEVRARCRNCEIRFSPAGSACPVLQGPLHSPYEVHCFNLYREGRLVGVMNLHVDPQNPISPELTIFLEGLFHQIELALQNVTLRNQELNTLRQIQMIHGPNADRGRMINTLLDGLQNALGAESVGLRENEINPWQAETGTYFTDATGLTTEEMDLLFDSAVRKNQIFKNVFPNMSSLLEDRVTGISVPLKLPDERILGSILVVYLGDRELAEREITFLVAFANQTAIILENEHTLMSMEYHTIIQERVRLAREIHDGLAQTLAYLKLQVSQMQNFLTQGNTARLSQALDQNYKVLQQAYLDIRQSIDNLRAAPAGDLVGWINHTVDDFEVTSGLHVERKLGPAGKMVSPEVQAQLVRIIQEALNNVRKHSKAQKVWISMHEWNSDVILEIGDDGEGFSQEDVPELTQYGLRGMRERAEFIGADFQIISQPLQGTVVRLRLPNYEEATI